MPSPFPGMDPYLEGSEWGAFHIEVSVEIQRQLSPQVQPKYHVLTMRRFITEVAETMTITRRAMYPDTAVIKETAAAWQATPPTPIQVATVMPTQIPHYVVEIRTASGRELVTTIELLPPANKQGQGYDDYLEKRNRILQSAAHLIEIDWLRNGRRLPMYDPLPPAPYYVFLSRVQKRPIVDVWPIQVADRLPVIPVPLLPEDADVTLDLQLVFDTVYDSIGYQTLLDYREPPEIPLAGETAVWIANLLSQLT